jgi:hypothetical protein
MRLAFILLPVLGLALTACSSSSGGSTPPSKTYIVMPDGTTTQCGAGTNTRCP